MASLANKIPTKKGSILAPYLKRSAEIIKGTTGEYFQEAMPTSSNIQAGIRDAGKDFKTKIGQNDIRKKIRELKTQVTLRNINNWFLNAGDEFGSGELGKMDFESSLSFDIETGEGEGSASKITEAQISAEEKSADQISKALVETTHKLMESQISSTANILTTIEGIGATLTSGFNTINDTLNKLLEITTKNTAGLITITAAASEQEKAKKDLAKGKFDMKAYRQSIAGNIKGDADLGMLSMASMLLQPGVLSSQMVLGTGLKALFDKKNPKFKKNLTALDESLNEVLMGSLVRLGEQKDKGGVLGRIAKIFGLQGGREDATTKRSKLELKPLQYNTVAQEALTNAIPGYLQRILIQLGGPEVVYDYRSRSFKSKSTMRKEFDRSMIDTGRFGGAGHNVKKAFSQDYANSEVRDMMMDLMYNELGGIDTAQSREKIKSLRTEAGAKTFLDELLADLPQVDAMRKTNASDLAKFTEALQQLGGQGEHELMNQIIRYGARKNEENKELLQEYEDLGIDTSEFVDTKDTRKKTYYKEYTKVKEPVVTPKPITLTGPDYANAALFGIYRVLNRGINTFIVGEKKIREVEYKGYRNLKPPEHYLISPEPSEGKPAVSLTGPDEGTAETKDKPKLSGEGERPKIGEDLKGWGKASGKNFLEAMFSGSPEEVKAAVGRIFGDVSGFATERGGEWLKKKNEELGNLTGYLRHKITGKGYVSRDEEGNEKVIADNKDSGLLGYFDQMIFGAGGAKGALKSMKNQGSKWFKTVAGYFAPKLKPGEEKEGQESKRKRIIGASIGAMAGLGILGGPLGLIVGGLAGNALITTGIGTKIKELIFGREATDKEKGKLGLLRSAVSKIVDPIRFQISKTMTTFASVFQRRIFGGLANLGEAIKERMSSAAGNVVTKTFMKVFGPLSWLIKKAFSLPFKIVTAPVTALGKLTRGVTEGAGAVIGGGLNKLARFINPDKAGHDRRVAQHKLDAQNLKRGSGTFGRYKKPAVDAEGKEGNYEELADDSVKRSWFQRFIPGSDFRDYQKGLEEDRKKLKLSNFTKETPGTPKEEPKLPPEQAEFNDRYTDYLKGDAERTANIESSTKISAEGVDRLVEEGIEKKASIATHDSRLYLKVMEIFDFLTEHGSGKGKGRKKGKAVPGKEPVATGSPAEVTHAITPDWYDINPDAQDRLDMEKESADEAAAVAMAGIGANAAMGKGGLDDEDVKSSMNLAEMATNDPSNKRGMLTRLKEIFKRNVDDSKEKEKDDKEGKSPLGKIWDTLKGFAGGILSNWKWLLGGGLLAALAFSGDKIIAGIGTALGKAASNIGSSINELWKWIKGDSDDKNAVNNVMSAPLDIAADSPIDYFNPLGNLYHVQKDAEGNQIHNVSAENARNQLITENVKRGAFNAAHGTNLKGSKFIKGLGTRMVGGLAGGFVGGKFGSKLGGFIADKMGLSEEGQAMWSRGGEAAGQIAGTTIGTVVNVGEKIKNIPKAVADSGVVKAGKVVASKVADAGKAVGSKISSAGKVIGETDIVKKVVEELPKLVKKILDKLAKVPKTLSKIPGFGKVLTTIKNLFESGLKVFKGKLAPQAVKLLAKIGSREGSKLIPVVGQAIGVVLGVGGAIAGFSTAENLFQVPKGKADAFMKLIATALGAALNGIPFIGMIEAFDLVTVPSYGIGVRQWIAQTLYSLAGEEKLTSLQGELEEERAAYNEKHGTNLDAVTYNDMVNKGFITKTKEAFGGAKEKVASFFSIKSAMGKDESTIAEGESLGEQVTDTTSRITGTLASPLEDINDALDEIEKGRYELDEDGKPLTLDGKNVPKGKLGDMIKSTLGGIASAVGNMLTGINSTGTQTQTQVQNQNSALSRFLNWVMGKSKGGIGGSDESGTSESTSNKSSVSSSKGETDGGGIGGLGDLLSSAYNFFFDSSQHKVANQKEGEPTESKSTVASPISPLDRPHQVTSQYGSERPGGTNTDRPTHEGVDIAAAYSTGNAQVANVNAVADGTITDIKTNIPDTSSSATNPEVTGNMIKYETDDGYAFRNLHLKAGTIPSGFRKESRVKAGQFIGEMGSTGRSTGPHLHFEAYKNGGLINPNYWLDGSTPMESMHDASASTFAGTKGKVWEQHEIQEMLNQGINEGDSPPKKFFTMLGNAWSGIKSKLASFIPFLDFGSDHDFSASLNEDGSYTSNMGNLRSGSVGQNSASIYLFFTKEKGITHETACAILGNLYQESILNPSATAIEPSSGDTAKGLAMWNSNPAKGPRWTVLLEMADDSKRKWDDLNLQLEFIWRELNNNIVHGGQTAWNFPYRITNAEPRWFFDKRDLKPLKGGSSEFLMMRDVALATRYFEAGYEASGDNEAGIQKRIGFAKGFEKTFRENPPTEADCLFSIDKEGEEPGPTVSKTTVATPSTAWEEASAEAEAKSGVPNLMPSTSPLDPTLEERKPTFGEEVAKALWDPWGFGKKVVGKAWDTFKEINTIPPKEDTTEVVPGGGLGGPSSFARMKPRSQSTQRLISQSVPGRAEGARLSELRSNILAFKPKASDSDEISDIDREPTAESVTGKPMGGKGGSIRSPQWQKNKSSRSVSGKKSKGGLGGYTSKPLEQWTEEDAEALSSNYALPATGTDFTRLEYQLTMVLGELRAINGNTSDANDYLETISNKQFGGPTPTDAKIAKALNSRPKKGPSPFSNNPNSINSIMSIVRPR